MLSNDLFGPTCLTLTLFASVSNLASAENNLTHLADNGLESWQSESFEGQTSYDVITLDGQTVLKASSKASASGLVLEQRIDLFQTPYLNWQWRTDSHLPLMDEQSKSGGDFVARVYVVIDGGMMIWRSKSLSYVWSSHQPQGSLWDNPFAGNSVQMLAVRGMDDPLGQWMSEKRNVYQDLIHYFGDRGSEPANENAYRYIDAVAIMTDSDNSGTSAEAYYGDLIFTEN